MNQEMDEIERLQKELEQSPEWDRLWSVREFHSTVEIFRANAAEVMRFLRESEQADTNESVFEVEAFRSLQQELARLVHNFAAAAFTLVEHARAFFGAKYGTSSLFAAYDAEVERRFRKNPLHNFLQGLRNYVVHQRFPAMTTMRSWSQGGRITHLHFWQRIDLLKSDRWNATAKLFLEQSIEQIYVKHVVFDYEKLVNEFYEWVFDRLKKFHASDEEVVAHRQRQIDLIVQHLATQAAALQTPRK